MDQLTFAFGLLRPDSDSLAKLICWGSRSRFFHVETKLNGRWHSAHFKTGVRFVDSLPNEGDPAYWETITIPELCTPEILAFAESICGAEYDPLGAFDSAFGIPLANPFAWFCSRDARELASRAGVVNLSPLPAPGLLYLQLSDHLTSADDFVSRLQGTRERLSAEESGRPALNSDDIDFVSHLVRTDRMSVNLADSIIHQQMGASA